MCMDLHCLLRVAQLRKESLHKTLAYSTIATQSALSDMVCTVCQVLQNIPQVSPVHFMGYAWFKHVAPGDNININITPNLALFPAFQICLQHAVNN